MKQRKIALGPGAASLILIIVMLSMCVLCMLTYISGKNDLALSQRSAAMVENVYGLNSRSEQSLAALDAHLAACQKKAASWDEYLAIIVEEMPQGMTLEGEEIAWEETSGDRALLCAVKLAPLGETPRITWTTHALTVATEEEWN